MHVICPALSFWNLSTVIGLMVAAVNFVDVLRDYLLVRREHLTSLFATQTLVYVIVQGLIIAKGIVFLVLGLASLLQGGIAQLWMVPCNLFTVGLVLDNVLLTVVSLVTRFWRNYSKRTLAGQAQPEVPFGGM